MEQVKNIGTLKGEILVFGGVYSNFQALQSLMLRAEELEIPTSNIICTGDILGYCAQPNECLELIREWGIHNIAGNVELNIKNDVEDCGCNFETGSRCDLFASNWYPFIQKTITPENKKWLQQLPEFLSFQYGTKSVFVLHGGLEDTSQFIFESTDWVVKNEIFEKSKADVILAGHCGLPFHSIQNKKYWFNSGVIGMPANDGTARTWYMTFGSSDEAFHFQHHPLAYENNRASRLMGENQLPLSYADTLITGFWDNMEILPLEEKAKRGKAISF